ncbi:hypothetical protein [Micromonospora deserti]|uniref:Uncharacterized protein n=1 Tax=Micromonospora deserti TaxID=2070366 RepID=A0A2W2DAM8_9ACTN|nr:hypothetical protein C1I99_25225 [Micromonospora deserti]
MRHEEQQVDREHPEDARSTPVPVPPPADQAGRADVPEDALDDRGTFDDPRVAGERSPADRDAEDAGRPEFHQPAPVPTAFGATSVGGAVAASALASPRPEDEPDPRTEETARPGDGVADGPREGRRADPTAEFHRGGHRAADQTDRRADAVPDRAERPAGTSVLPPDASEGRPERRADLTGWAGDPDAAAAGGAGYGRATPSMVDPDRVSPDADPVLARATAAGSLEAAGTARPAGSTVAAEPATLFDPAAAQGFRDRWRDVQLRFVDDPRAAAGEAQSLVDEAIQALASALSAQKDKLGAWQEAASADTEQLRVAVRQYRDFLDRVLGR